MKSAISEKSNSVEGVSSENSRERIEARAYEIYQQRGREHGRDVEDWLQAESDVIQKRGRDRPVLARTRNVA
jgi:hypothetical protein